MGWIEGESIATRQRCGVCSKVDPVMFLVPDDVWKRVVPNYHQNDRVCLMCFCSFADERLVAWEKGIEFFPRSLRTHLEDVRGITLSESEPRNEMTELAKEIAGHLGSEDRRDIEAIESWLMDGWDDGSPAEVLADRFDWKIGLPSRRELLIQTGEDEST